MAADPLDAAIDEIMNESAQPVTSETTPVTIKKEKKKRSPAAANEAFEMFKSPDDTIEDKQKRTMSSLSHALSAFADAQKGDLVRYELLTSKTMDYVLVRGLKSPNGAHVKLFKRLRGDPSKPITVDDEKKSDDKSFIVLRRKKASIKKTKPLGVKKDKKKPAEEKTAKSPKKQPSKKAKSGEEVVKRLEASMTKLAQKAKGTGVVA